MFLFLPGIVCHLLVRQLKGSKEKKDWEHFLNILIYSLASYCVLGMLLNVTGKGRLVFWDAISTETAVLQWKEIVYASIVATVLAFVISGFYTYKLVNKVGRFLQITRRYGDEDVWDFFHNMHEVEWTVVRDHKLDLAYFGWIHLFSDSERERELLLRDVSVQDNATGKYLYDVEALYLSRDKYDLTIEIPREQPSVPSKEGSDEQRNENISETNGRTDEEGRTKSEA